MERYSRQVLFPPIGNNGQLLIRSKHVLVIGAGALGSAITEMLVRAGVGILTIIDRDYVEFSNLQRQHLYTEKDAEQRMPKAIAAKQRLIEVNKDVEIIAIVEDAEPSILEELAGKVHLIIDATDNFETRMMINDVSQKYRIPWIYGACVGSTGMSLPIIPGKTPCLSCLMKTIPVLGLTCDTGGIIAPAVQMTAAYQMAEAMKILTENVQAVRETLIFFDIWSNQSQTIKVGKAKQEGCLSCGLHPTYPFLEAENRIKTTILCGRDTIQVRPPKKLEIHFDPLAERLISAGVNVHMNAFLLSIQWEELRFILFKDGRALLHGTKDEEYAKSVYQKIVG